MPSCRVTLVIAVLLLAAVPGMVAADTLMIVGVVIGKDGRRIPGVMVRLYATSNRTGRPIAEDRTSERGVFNLYRTNIAGDLGELYVVYDGDDGVAEPLRASLKTAQIGLLEARPGDLTLLPTPKGMKLTKEEAAERMTALANTQAVLIAAGVTDKEKSKDLILARSGAILDALPPYSEQVSETKRLTERKIRSAPKPVSTAPSLPTMYTVEVIRSAKRSEEVVR